MKVKTILLIAVVVVAVITVSVKMVSGVTDNYKTQNVDSLYAQLKAGK